jgi:hypothetical protein
MRGVKERASRRGCAVKHHDVKHHDKKYSKTVENRDLPNSKTEKQIHSLS